MDALVKVFDGCHTFMATYCRIAIPSAMRHDGSSTRIHTRALGCAGEKESKRHGLAPQGCLPE